MLTCHRERHLPAAAFGGSALPGSGGNAASLDGERSKIDGNRAAAPRGPHRATPRETAPDVDRERLAAMEVSRSRRSAEGTWMDIAASNLARAQTTRAVGGPPLAQVIGSPR